MVNMGTLLAFVIVSIAEMGNALDESEPAAAVPHADGCRWFRFCRLIANGYMMAKLGMWNWIRLIVWLAIGLIVYFNYGVKHSKVQGAAVGIETMICGY